MDLDKRRRTRDKRLYKHVPDEVAQHRKRKDKRRTWIGAGFFTLWWLAFIISIITKEGWVLIAAYPLVLAEIAFLNGWHEKALRKITSRPQVNYRAIRKLERKEIKNRDAS